MPLETPDCCTCFWAQFVGTAAVEHGVAGGGQGVLVVTPPARLGVDLRQLTTGHLVVVALVGHGVVAGQLVLGHGRWAGQVVTGHVLHVILGHGVGVKQRTGASVVGHIRGLHGGQVAGWAQLLHYVSNISKMSWTLLVKHVVMF